MCVFFFELRDGSRLDFFFNFQADTYPFEHPCDEP